MSIKYLKPEVDRFLLNNEASVLCIKGKWGIGKTYAWNAYLMDAISEKKVALKKYAYISLFGLKNLGELKYYLFESTTNIDQVSVGPTEKSLKENISWIKNNHRKITGFLSKLPIFQSYLGGSENTLFFGVRDQIICIDDLERTSSELEIKDVLGLISYLKEQRRCKIVLLLNDTELRQKDKVIFTENLEKVTDLVFDFTPLPFESADIVFPLGTRSAIQEMLFDNCTTLGIINIRVIKKIETISNRLNELLSNKYPDLLPQAIHSATLLAWAVYQPNEAPPLDLIGNLRSLLGTFSKKDMPEEYKLWQEILTNYKYTNTDFFDEIILEGIQLGYFDKERFMIVAHRKNEEVQTHLNDTSFREAWGLYHDSFEQNDDLVFESIFNATKNYMPYITAGNLNSVVEFLKEFDRTTQVKELIDEYVKVKPNDKVRYENKHTPFGYTLTDPDLLRIFEDKISNLEEPKDFGKILVGFGSLKSWEDEHIPVLSELKVDDFVTLFTTNYGEELRLMIKGALMFEKTGGATKKMISISRNAKEALKKIAGSSKLNAKRISTSHGVILD